MEQIQGDYRESKLQRFGPRQSQWKISRQLWLSVRGNEEKGASGKEPGNKVDPASGRTGAERHVVVNSTVGQQLRP